MNRKGFCTRFVAISAPVDKSVKNVEKFGVFDFKPGISLFSTVFSTVGRAFFGFS